MPQTPATAPSPGFSRADMMSVGEISARLGLDLVMTSNTLAKLGFTPVQIQNARLYPKDQYPAMAKALAKAVLQSVEAKA